MFLPLHGNSLLVNYQLPDLIVLWLAVCVSSLEGRWKKEVHGGKARIPMAQEGATEGTVDFKQSSPNMVQVSEGKEWREPC